MRNNNTKHTHQKQKVVENMVIETTTSCSKQPVLHFVLVHGIGGGGWCWYKIRCLMEHSGFQVSCIDLKSAGIDPSDANSIHSFDDYNKPLLDLLSALPHHQQVILVGHSAGGMSVTHAMHMFADKIKLAVYVGATMLKTGFSTDEDVKDGAPDLSEYGDSVYDLEFKQGPNHPPTSCIVNNEFQRKLIYHMSPPEDFTLATMLLRPGPIRALQSAKFTEESDVDQVPRVYIKTTHDRVLKTAQQDAMIKRWPPSLVYSLESDHSPFFSSPFLLFGLLVKAAASISDV